ncbi:amino acid/amide ABC transporter membrane protein 2, HAAT family [Azospirillum oryzae]|uniref:Amino acid/amide ABC transporter membrane protein 2, HAAT family n=1 Tax=Azospirillum oryzae TaxID=286727 RepID=A0A1X7HKM6_9PROT|nr:amino acid/amide ABC transporter membrane protein 2, HAAT family [Azospirillum oryzae]
MARPIPRNEPVKSLSVSYQGAAASSTWRGLAMGRGGSDLVIAVLLGLAALATLLFGEAYWLLAAQVAITMIFALSVDLLVGFAGIVTLGHAVFFGLGAYAVGIASVQFGWTEPLSALLLAGAVSALLGAATGVLVLRTRGLGQLMLTMAFASLVYEIANRAKPLTGGADGLQGMVVSPVAGLFEFDIFGLTAFVYTLAVLIVVVIFAVLMTRSPYGRSLVGIRENRVRMQAIGTGVQRRLLSIYIVSAALAGIAGALLAQTSQFVGLNVLHFSLSGEILIIVALGGAGRLWGALLGAVVFTLFKDRLSALDPAYWYFWLGLLLAVIVLFAPKGLIGLVDRLLALFRSKEAA